MSEQQEKNYELLILQYMSKSEVSNNIQTMINENKKRLVINLDKVRDYDSDLANYIIRKPIASIKLFEAHLKTLVEEVESNQTFKKPMVTNTHLLTKKEFPYKVTFEGMFGKNLVSPRGLNSSLTNQLVCIQGIITRQSIVRPKLVHSVHYCEETNQGSIKEYSDQYTLDDSIEKMSMNKFSSNSIPLQDLHGNPLLFEYGLSYFRDFQIILVQEPPERTPVGQLPRSIEVVLADDLVDQAKPGDR